MEESIKERIIGTWKLVSWKYLDAVRGYIDFFGEHPLGILTYDACGYMNAQLMKRNRTSFASNSMTEGTPEEIEDAYFNYVAYWGKYYEKAPGEIVHVVEGSLFPNWMGGEQVRYGKLDGKYLTLSTPPMDALENRIVFNLIWEKA